jgi:hypothetical protein
MKKNMYVIIKHVKMNDNRKRLPVVLLNADTEIWEFETLEEAKKMKEIFETNSDSGHEYEVKKI